MADVNPEYDEYDDIEDETLVERLIGLTEMFPEPLTRAVSSLATNGVSAGKTCFGWSRSVLWFASTTFLLMGLPYIIEKERIQFEKQHIAQQRQMLLGPSAAMQSMKR